MTAAYIDIIRQASSALEPQPTQTEPQLSPLSGIRAVLFDIYGTLLISASGDIGAADPTVRGDAFVAAIEAVGWEFPGDGTEGAMQLRATIERHHARARERGVAFPEVDIVAVWRETCEILSKRGVLRGAPPEADFGRVAIEFEVRTNPVWPMPGLLECLGELRASGRVMGIISNAQFFTPLLFPAVAGADLQELGFAQNLGYYSYMHGLAKPGTELYRMAAEGLHQLDIKPGEVLYVGNDVRNDVWPAGAVGFRTALFAGDQRSLRMRAQDEHHQKYGKADVIVTNLEQIPTLIDNRD